MVVTTLSKCVLELLQLKGIGPAKLTSAGLTKEAFKETESSVRDRAQGKELTIAQARADEVLRSCADHKIGITSIFDASYPRRLSGIRNAPILLYYQGNIGCVAESACAAVVGTRDASLAGEKYAARVTAALVNCGYCIVSGLALGIDTVAHTTALEENGLTVAVLAHGLDRVTPARNRSLAERILDNRGCLLSEHAPGVPPRPPEYAKRNRIQSGLSVFSVMVESGKVGGTIHQARFTVEQKRGLLVVRPHDLVPGLNTDGANYLIDEYDALPISTELEIREYAKAHKTGIEPEEFTQHRLL